LEKQAAGEVRQKGPDPGNQVVIDPLVSEVGAEDRGIDIVKTSFNIEEEQGDFATRALEGTDRVS